MLGANLVVLAICVWYGVIKIDEGWYVVSTRFALHGRVPYNEWAWTQGPVLPYVLAPFQAVASGVTSARVVSATCAGLGIVLTIITSRRLSGNVGALLTGLLLVCLAPTLQYWLEVVKTYGTLDRISGGRVILGVGVGSLQPEFELLEVPFDDRGPRADDAMRAIRASLAKPEPSYDGPYYRFGGMIIDPCAVQAHMPIWVGGRTRRSLRRAVELGDGWMPFGLGVDELGTLVKSVGIPAGFDLALSPDRALDPGGGTERVLDTIGQMESIGTTVINARICLLYTSPSPRDRG